MVWSARSSPGVLSWPSSLSPVPLLALASAAGDATSPVVEPASVAETSPVLCPPPPPPPDGLVEPPTPIVCPLAPMADVVGVLGLDPPAAPPPPPEEDEDEREGSTRDAEDSSATVGGIAASIGCQMPGSIRLGALRLSSRESGDSAEFWLADGAGGVAGGIASRNGWLAGGAVFSGDRSGEDDRSIPAPRAFCSSDAWSSWSKTAAESDAAGALMTPPGDSRFSHVSRISVRDLRASRCFFRCLYRAPRPGASVLARLMAASYFFLRLTILGVVNLPIARP